MVDKIEHGYIQLERALRRLGCSSAEVQVFRTLVTQGASTVLQVSRAAKIPRTTAYRILESMAGRGLLKAQTRNKKRFFAAADFEDLSLLVAEETERMRKLQQELPKLRGVLGAMPAMEQPGTQVLFHEGALRIRQMLWRALESKEIVGYLYMDYAQVLGTRFSELYHLEQRRRKIRCRDLISDDDSLLTKESYEYYTNPKIFPYYRWRYLPAGRITINHQIQIYGEAVNFFTWNRERREYYGAEIRNKGVASLQRQIFEFLWEQAEEPAAVLQRRRKR
jgi:sugar-specific transcriptional regulator TrmB